MRNLLRYIGLRHIRLKPLRTTLTFLGVAFGIALYVAISMINESTRKSIRENIESVSGKSKLSIDAGPSGFAEDKLEIIRVVPGVKAAVPILENRAYLSGSTTTTESLYIMGVDLLQESAVRTYEVKEGERVIDDPLVFLNQPDSLIVTQAFAARNNLKIDSKIVLATAKENKTFTVRGLLAPEGAAKAYGGNLAIMDIDGARVMFAKENKIDRVDILPKDGVAIATLRQSLKTALGEGFNVEEPEAAGDNMERMVKTYQLMLTFFSSLALLVGLFLIYNSTSVSIAERRKEIGILRALGASRKSILLLFVLEATVVGLLGSAFGCVLGKFLSHYLVDQVTMAVSNQFATPIKVNTLVLTMDQVLFTLAIGGITSAFAAFLPAYKASLVAPTEAMRARGMDHSSTERAGRNSWLFGLAAYVFSILIMILELPRYWHPLEQVSQGASVLGSAFFGPALVFFLIYTLRHLLRRLPSGSKRTLVNLAQENLLRSRARTSSNIMALMVGLYFVMLVATVRASFQNSILNWLGTVVTADLMITPSGRAITAEVQPVDPALESEILKVPGIKPPGEGRGSRSRITQLNYAGAKIFVRAHDEPSEASLYRSFAIVGQDRISTAKRFYASTEPAILVSENFVMKHPETKAGGILRVGTPSGAVDFRVIAIVKDFASPEGVFHFTRKTYAKYWKDDLVTSFAFYLENPADLEKVRTELDQKVLGKYGLISVSNAELRKMIEDIVNQSFAYTRAVELAALLVALLGLLNTLLISVLERTREIGMMRAIGSLKRQIYRLIMLESLIQGGFGAIVATLLGGTIGYFYIKFASAVSMGWIIDFYLPASSVIVTVLTGVVVSILAGVIPARRASNLKIVDALDQE